MRRDGPKPSRGGMGRLRSGLKAGPRGSGLKRRAPDSRESNPGGVSEWPQCGQNRGPGPDGLKPPGGGPKSRSRRAISGRSLPERSWGAVGPRDIDPRRESSGRGESRRSGAGPGGRVARSFSRNRGGGGPASGRGGRGRSSWAKAVVARVATPKTRSVWRRDFFMVFNGRFGLGGVGSHCRADAPERVAGTPGRNRQPERWFASQRVFSCRHLTGALLSAYL